MAGLADDAGIVPAARQHEGDVGVAEQADLVDRVPRRDVVLLGADGEDRHPDVGEHHRPAVDRVAARARGVLQEQRLQVLAVHARRHAGAVRVPGHQVGQRARARPAGTGAPGATREVVGAQQPERAGHLRRVQIALVPHQVLEIGELALVDEQHQLARFGEVGLRREQASGSPAAGRRRGHRRPPRWRGWCRRGSSRMAWTRRPGTIASMASSAAITPAGGSRRGRGRDAARRVLPGDREDRVPCRHEIAHQRVLGRQVENVIFHDPGRHDQHRLGLDLGRGRAVLDQLHQIVAIDDVARRDGDVAADDIASQRMPAP